MRHKQSSRGLRRTQQGHKTRKQKQNTHLLKPKKPIFRNKTENETRLVLRIRIRIRIIQRFQFRLTSEGPEQVRRWFRRVSGSPVSLRRFEDVTDCPLTDEASVFTLDHLFFFPMMLVSPGRRSRCWTRLLKTEREKCKPRPLSHLATPGRSGCKVERDCWTVGFWS